MAVRDFSSVQEIVDKHCSVCRVVLVDLEGTEGVQDMLVAQKNKKVGEVLVEVVVVV